MVTITDLGHTVRDVVTGFSGVMTGYVTYLSGCHQGLVAPKVKDDGTLAPGEWFDVQRLSITDTQPRVCLDNSRTPGHDRQAPRRNG